MYLEHNIPGRFAPGNNLELNFTGGDLDDYTRGYEQFRQMVGDEQIEGLVQRFGAVCPDFADEVVSVVGGRIWTRGGIDLKTRSLCSIAILAALGRVNALKLNFQMAIRNGAQIEEIFEALFQVAVYAGFPAAWDALVMFEQVLAEEAEQRAATEPPQG